MSTLDNEQAAPAGSDDRAAGSLRTGRRAWLAMGAGAVAGALVGARAGAQQGKGKGGVDRVTLTASQLAPTESPALGWKDPTLRLLRRTSYAITAADASLAKRLGYRGYLEYQLAWDKIDDRAAEQFVAQTYPLVRQTYAELLLADQGQVVTQAMDAAVYRAAFSQRQLYERMVEFWTDHLNINIRDVQLYKLPDDREVVRKHALGNFGDLIRASAHSSAMLLYLDNNVNRRGAPNQNYARELMELHTLGVDGGYTQQDVAELARVLTGWTVDGRTGAFRWDPGIHDFGAKTVMGQSLPAIPATTGTEGMAEGNRMIDFLIAHPNTATFIATKLLRFFVTHDPSEAQVREVAATFTKTKGDIRSVLRTVLQPAWISTAPPLFKRPFHYVVGSVRAAGTTLTSVRTLATPLQQLGHLPFTWETPDGFPWRAEHWAGNTLPRWNWGNTLANATASTFAVDIEGYRKGGTAAELVESISQRIFAGELTTRQREQLTAYISRQPTSAARARETLSLAIASSNFQWY